MKRLKITGIIGDPIRHSLSPVMQNAAFQKAGLPFVYVPFHVRPRELGHFLRQAASWKDLAGLNVTIPHKEAVLKYVTDLSPEAKAIGAVNTLVFSSKGVIQGHNTDAPGYLASLREETKFSPRGKTIVVLGAGGAARAILYILAYSGVSRLIVVNRTPGKAQVLVREFQRRFGKTRFEASRLERNRLRTILPQADLLVNTTSVGLNQTRFSQLPLDALNKKAIVSDLVYRPLLTPLLKDAKRRGNRIHPGFGMLLHQGVLSFRRWTKKRPDVAVMRKALLDALKRS